MDEKNQNAPIVYLVDDDESLLRSSELMLSSSGFKTRSFASAQAFERFLGQAQAERDSGDRWPREPSCLLLDINMPEMSGPTLFHRIVQLGLDKLVPVIFLTGHASVPLAVELMASGALHFIEKPADPDYVIRYVRKAHGVSAEALGMRRQAEESRKQLAEVESIWQQLTPREAEIISLVGQGYTNKRIGQQLNISEHTVRNHRLSAREKLGTKDNVALTRFLQSRGLDDSML